MDTRFDTERDDDLRQRPPRDQREPGTAGCSHLPQLTRLTYFYGQMLGAADLRMEQAYFRERSKLHNRCLHGYGTVCGLRVVPVPPPPCCESEHERERADLRVALEAAEERLAETTNDEQYGAREAEVERLRRELEAREQECRHSGRPHLPRVHVECGLALDCAGNELIVRAPIDVDLWAELPVDERRGRQPVCVWVTLCYCEHGIDPTPPLLPDACGATPSCQYGKIRDGVRVRVSTKPPAGDHRCDTCCDACADEPGDFAGHGHEHCVVLARVDGVSADHIVRAGQVHNDVRRLVGRQDPTTITGISWVHGGRYRPDAADHVLGTFDHHHGIKIRFSRPVWTETITPGVLDLWVIEGGRGRSGEIEHLEGRFVDLPDPAVQPTVMELTYRHAGRESLNEGDRVLVTLRTDFILDECCNPVDGNHVGGLVPLLEHCRGEHHPPPRPTRCLHRPYGPWTSGNGQPGGAFESWFYIGRHHRHEDRP